LLYPEEVHKVIARGKTPAGTHRPILVPEILGILNPKPGETAVDCTLGFGGHSQAMLPLLLPGGRLLGIDADPLELPRTEARLRAAGFGPREFTAHRCNFAGVASVLARETAGTANVILADLGVSSMQLDNPNRGFSLKFDGPLDMRMNPEKGRPASEILLRLTPSEVSLILQENADEPHFQRLGEMLAGKKITSTQSLALAVRKALATRGAAEQELSVRRVFQALRIAVNQEFETLDTLLKQLPGCLSPGGRVAILTFHSGEDRRVKKAFESDSKRAFTAKSQRL
jgi:16S rRNA (cytosine1402-N4)-methyltransferase